MMHHLKRILINHWRYFCVAIQFFTRIPVQIKQFQEDDLNNSTAYFPLVGILVGSVAACIFTLFNQFLPLSIAVLISMITTLMLTGGFHEDGLADAADGLGGGWEKEQVLKIMVDSRIGSYGALALIMALLIKYQSLVELSKTFIPTALICGHAISRLSAVLVMMTLPYVKSEGKSKPLATKLSRESLSLALFFGLIPLLLLPFYQWFALIPVVLIWRWFSFKIKTRIGGYTGDCLGAMQQLSEILFYIGLLASHELNLVHHF